MKKKLLTLTLALFTAASLAACGAGGQSGAPAASSASSEEASAEETAAEETSAAEEASAEETTEEATEETAEETTEETADGESDVAYIQEKGTLIVGITDFAPMDYQEAGSDEWIGFDADLAKKVAEDLGVEVEFIVIDWDNKILELENKSIDVVWNGMTLTNEVKNAMECSNPYLNNAQVVVMKEDAAADYPDAESMADLSFAVEAGSAGEAAATENGFETTAVQDQASALMEVNAGTSDACIIDLLMAGAMIGEGTSYADMVTTVELTTEEYGIGCRKGSDLAAYINDELKAFETDGSLLEIAEQYGVHAALVPQN